MANRSTFSFVSQQDGLTLSGLIVAPEKPVGAVLLIHGMSEHKERYLPLMEVYAKAGYLCGIYDQRGHGESRLPGKPLGYFGKNGANHAVEDARQAVEWLRERAAGHPLYVYGHSMGSLVARGLRNRYGDCAQGYVFSGTPGKVTKGGAGRSAIAMLSLFGGDVRTSRVMDWLCMGSFSRSFQYEGSRFAWLSTDPAVARAYEADPLCGFSFTLNGYRALMDLIDLANQTRPASGKDRPVLFLSGEADPCMPTAAALHRAMEVTRKTGCLQVACKIYPMLRHELHNEPGREVIFQETIAHLEAWRRGEYDKDTAIV